MPPEEEEAEYLLVGRIVKPHGLRGEVLVRGLSDNPGRFAAGAELEWGPDLDSAEPITVVSSRDHKGALLVFFEGIHSLEEAEPLRDWLLFVNASEVDDLEDEDAFWEHEVIGLDVVDTQGRTLGKVAEVMTRPAQDLWSIDTGSGEVLFPAAKELVVSVDLDAGKVVIDPPEGLF
ncbi:MAG TPA: ribosome maturation factor RimM [Actinomycetota bacterium]|nr:ribosome maturation factor RimM [Actinomycetota bacterium]